MKILIAEDDKDIAFAYKKILSSKGHQITCTHDGFECLDTYKKEISVNNNYFPPYDLVIIDYSMPEMTGATLAKEIKSINSKQRIIFATAHPDDLIDTIVPTSMEIEILSKPFDYSDLINLLEKQIA